MFFPWQFSRHARLSSAYYVMDRKYFRQPEKDVKTASQSTRCRHEEFTASAAIFAAQSPGGESKGYPFDPIVDPSSERIGIVLLLIDWYLLFRRRFPPKDEVDIKDLQVLCILCLVHLFYLLW